METTEYRITISAYDKHGVKLADLNQTVTWEYLRRSRPRLMKAFINDMVERFLRGHREIEKDINKQKPKKRSHRRRMSLESLLEFRPGDCA